MSGKEQENINWIHFLSKKTAFKMINSPKFHVSKKIKDIERIQHILFGKQ